MAELALQRSHLLQVSTSQTTPTQVPLTGRRKFFRIFSPLVEKSREKPEDSGMPSKRSQSPNAPGGGLNEPITGELVGYARLRRGSLAFRLCNSLVEGYDAIRERLSGTHVSPMARLERAFLRQKTTDWAQAMEKSLLAVLQRDGYSYEFRSEVLALTPNDKAVRGLEHEYMFCGTPVTHPDQKVERLFVAAFALLQDADSGYGLVRPSNAQILGAIRLMNDLLPNLSSEQVSRYLDYAHTSIPKGSNEKKLEVARLFARMCNRTGISSIDSVSRERDEVSLLTDESDPGTAAAAALFMEKTTRRVIDADPTPGLVNVA